MGHRGAKVFWGRSPKLIWEGKGFTVGQREDGVPEAERQRSPVDADLGARRSFHAVRQTSQQCKHCLPWRSRRSGLAGQSAYLLLVSPGPFRPLHSLTVAD